MRRCVNGRGGSDEEDLLGSALPDDMAWLRLGALVRRLAAQGISAALG